MLVEDGRDGRRYVLKATLAESGAEAVHAEHLTVRHFRSQDPGLMAPEAIPSARPAAAGRTSRSSTAT
ncbi:hypothetical protein ADL01_06435 [Streptomyces sp. NRRL WC-3618]|uniref:hypothetical protein n=1 Tax=Streptomyces sp. NRRL WC-3618 TaxID=1519490 RepID=UPI0006AF733D|nr:hypothetical protein [Streptomyces sp. NRRL WC-3618]KOV86502.1 hypothetical protein ADL01_06435 [Streptomyces sp. NRRL WC-3618]